MKVRIHGYLDFYAPTGRLTLKMGGIDPRFTLGDLAQQRDQVLRRLVAGGLIDRNKRRRLSPVPLRIGVVTSVGSAAWHDFENELKRERHRLPAVRLRRPGAGRPRRGDGRRGDRLLACRPLDAVVVIRGGGARNELAVFDAEAIAMAIAAPPSRCSPASATRSTAASPTRSPTPRSRRRRRAPSTSCRRPASTSATPSGPTPRPSTAPATGSTAPSSASATAPTASPGAPMPPSAVPTRASPCGSGRCVAARRRQLGSAERRLEAASSQLRARSRQALAAEQRHVDALAGPSQDARPGGDARARLDDHPAGRRRRSCARRQPSRPATSSTRSSPTGTCSAPRDGPNEER